jgi:hypothetical protein
LLHCRYQAIDDDHKSEVGDRYHHKSVYDLDLQADGRHQWLDIIFVNYFILFL